MTDDRWSIRVVSRLSVAPRLATAVAAALSVAQFALVLACAPGEEEQISEIHELHAESRFAETLDPLRSLLDARPDDPEFNHLYGVALLATGNSGMAVWPLRKAAETPERAVEDGLLLARALAQGAVPQDAVAVAGRVLALEPDHVEALLLRAGVNLELRHYEQVLVDVDRALALEPDRWQALLWRVKALAELGRIDEAEEALSTGAAQLAELPNGLSLQPRVCGAAAQLAQGRDDLQEAERKWEECLAEFPAAPALVEEGVRFFDELGKQERATDVLRRAIGEKPDDLALRTTLAQRLETMERSEQAEKLLLEATARDENDHAAWLALADYYRAREEYPAALRAVERVLRVAAVPPIVLARYADDLIQVEEFEKADEVIASLESPAMVKLLQGRALLARGEPAEALEVLEEGLRLWPGNPTGRYLAGQAAEQLGDFDRAISEYRDSVRADAAHTEAALLLARLHAAEGQYDPALLILGHRIEAKPEEPDAYVATVRIASRAGLRVHVSAALRKLAGLPGQETAVAVEAAAARARLDGSAAAVKAIERSGLDLTRPENALALAALVEHLAGAGREAEAVERTRVALQAHPDHAAFLGIHARALRAAGRPRAEVREALERALEIGPESGAVLADLARLEAEEGRTEAALALYDRATSADPEDSASAWAAIELARAPERPAELDRRLEALLERDPRHAGAAGLLAARLLERGGDLDRAEALASRAVRFQGGAEALDTQGRIAIARGETEDAVRAFRLSLELRPDSPSTRYHLGRALAAEGDRIGARDALREALKAADFPEASAARAELVQLDSSADGV